VRLILRIYDALAQMAAHQIIIDSPALASYVLPVFRKKMHYVAYSGDHVPPKSGEKIEGPKYGLTICRIEPENNLETTIAGFLKSNLPRYIIIGNWNHSAFSRALREKYAGEPRLQFLDPIYDQSLIARYRENCTIYFHGHSVGGTNPSLVEMLFYACPILCFDCSFNRHTAGKNAKYFSSAENLASVVNETLAEEPAPRHPETLVQYTKKRIAEQYIEFCLH
jgi:glycosyltransferase involved in cell wall biosynthesis